MHELTNLTLVRDAMRGTGGAGQAGLRAQLRMGGVVVASDALLSGCVRSGRSDSCGRDVPADNRHHETL